MDSKRREFIRNQAAVKQCKRFVVFTVFTNYFTPMDDEMRLQLEEDEKYGDLDSIEKRFDVN